MNKICIIDDSQLDRENIVKAIKKKKLSLVMIQSH